jgi:hypothetical protein
MSYFVKFHLAEVNEESTDANVSLKEGNLVSVDVARIAMVVDMPTKKATSLFIDGINKGPVIVSEPYDFVINRIYAVSSHKKDNPEKAKIIQIRNPKVVANANKPV